MSRIGRFVVPDLPHHVTQRGNRREKVIFGEDDYALYRDLHDSFGGLNKSADMSKLMKRLIEIKYAQRG